MLSGMTASSIGPDSNQVQQALGKLKWLCVMDSLPDHELGVLARPRHRPREVQTEVFALPATHWIEKDGSFTNSGRWLQWKDAVLPPEHESRHDHWILAELFLRVRELYRRDGGKFPDPVMDLTMPYRDPAKPELDEIAQEVNGKDLKSGKRLDDVRRPPRRRQHVGRQLDLHRVLSRERQPDEAAQRRAGPEGQRPDRHGLLPRVGVVLAAEPPRALQPRVGRPAGPALGPEAGRHPVGRAEEAVGRRRARLPAGRGSDATPSRRSRSS